MATDDSKAITLRELAIRTIEQLTARIDVLKDFSEDIHKEQQMESEKKQQRFGALRAELTRCGYTQQELGIGIRRSLTYMNLRFNGKSQWELEDM